MHALTLSRAVKGANLLFAGAQSVLGQTSRLTGLGTPVDQRPETFHAGTPIPPAFSIWGPLFISEALYAWRVARDGESRLHRDIAPLTALAFAGNTAWEVQAELRGFEWQSNAIILGAAASAIGAIVKAERGDYPEEEKRKVRLPVGTLAGWLIAACAANAEASRIQMLGRPERDREEKEAMALVALATAAAATVTYAANGSAHVAAGSAWGLAGIAARGAMEKRPPMVVAPLVGIAIVGLAVFAGKRRVRARPA
jgi:hypothetical protein